jgi:transposase
VEKNTIYVALDDSKRKLVVAIVRPEATEAEEREIPKDSPHIQQLFRRLRREGPVQACYEAGVSGYDLYRQITACEVACHVIAPALTPRRPGQRIKTDRRDARKLVRLFRAGALTAIRVPNEAEEAARDVVRCREDVRRDGVRWRHRLLTLLDRHGRLWVAEKNWTQRHGTWIRAQHFRRPRNLMAYLGLVPSEYSSGETHRRGALTKAGNTHARRVLVEAAWPYRHRPTVGRALASRSQAQPEEVVR